MKRKAILVAVVILLAVGMASADILYDVIDLGTLGGNRSEVHSVSNNGQIVGEAMDEQSQYYATLFDPTGQGNNIDLNTLINPVLGWTLENAGL